MNIIICENYEEVSARAASMVADVIKKDSACKLGLATGSTPIGMYSILSEMYKNGEIDFSSVSSYNLDEYYPIKKDNDQSYDYFMRENLFSKINIKEENIHIPNGEAKDANKECEDYECTVEKSGGIDIQILGLGVNGHIGFNEPANELISKTHVTDLTVSTIKANSRFFESEDEVPKKAITMGVGTIMKAKSIVLMVSGKNKHEALSAILNGNISTNVPATLLNLHPNVTVICDKEAYYGNDL